MPIAYAPVGRSPTISMYAHSQFQDLGILLKLPVQAKTNTPCRQASTWDLQRPEL